MNIEDHLIKMKGGKLYCPVYVRIALFRDKCPICDGWGIVTECIEGDSDSALYKTSITDPAGRVVATGYKREHRAHFPDYEEKAGTGSVGRALLMAGFGTQYALDELDEGERIVDTPIPAPSKPVAVSNPDVVAKKAYSAAATAFISEVKRIWSDSEIGPQEAKSVYRKIYGTDNMTTAGLMDAVTRLSVMETPGDVSELFMEEG
jgi:hypothetical protein